MNLLGLLLQGIVSGVLTLAPAAVLKRDGLKASIAYTFFAIFAICKLGGLVFAVPATLFFLLWFSWVRFVGHAISGPKRVLFFMTGAFSALYLACQIVHLPIREALKQSSIMLMANEAGIYMAGAMFIAIIELAIVKRQASGN
jgi:hypothetical protein